MSNKMIKCVLCKEPAITTAGPAPVCEKHYKEYQAEGRQYLAVRTVYNRILNAYYGERK